MVNIEEALKTAGAEKDLQTILEVLEEKENDFDRYEPAAGPFAALDSAVLKGLSLRARSAIKRAQQQQGPQGKLSASVLLHSVDTCALGGITLRPAFKRSHKRLSMSICGSQHV